MGLKNSGERRCILLKHFPLQFIALFPASLKQIGGKISNGTTGAQEYDDQNDHGKSGLPEKYIDWNRMSVLHDENGQQGNQRNNYNCFRFHNIPSPR
jgi:hypothetical protein